MLRSLAIRSSRQLGSAILTTDQRLFVVGGRCLSSKSSNADRNVDPEGVYLTERGAERLEMLKKTKKDDRLKLRLSVEGGGCSGFSYVFNVTPDQPKEDDRVFEHHGAILMVDDTSLELVKGSTIDFTEDLIRRSFEVVDNPNAESGCGCGTSFSAKMADI